MKELLGRDIGGQVDFSLPPPSACYDIALAENAAAAIVAPVNFNRAFFSFAIGTNNWVTLDGSAPIVPSSGAATTQELNPAVRQISTGGQTIKIISDTASFVNVRFDTGQ